MDHIKIMLREFNAKLAENIFTNKQLGMTADVKIAVLMVSE